ncbi:MAG: ABC transporter substrate-binding protein [Dehalococcoidia bacterium]|nr:ABC transporter substrate-binding protein [Dehalococcoidia bacterium]
MHALNPAQAVGTYSNKGATTMAQDRADQVWERPLSRRQLVSAMAVGGASLALLGCGDDDEDAATPAVSSQPKHGGKVTLHGFSLAVVDPHKTIGVTGPSDLWGYQANSVLRLDWQKGTPTDGLAEKWEAPDPTTVVLTLKKGVHFQKESAAGPRELDSGDVVASLERSRTTGDATFAIAGRFRLVDTYTAVDKYTVRVKFKKPDANFLSFMYHPTAAAILPREAIQKYGADMTVPAAWYGTGPFVPDPSTYKTGISINLKRNPSYDVDPGGLPYLDEITAIYIADQSARDAALRTGQLDVGLVPTLAEKQFRSEGYQMSSTENVITAAQHLAMNTQIAPTNDVRVRQAIHRALDRVELANVVGDGFACTPIILGCRTAWYLSEKEWAEKPGFRKDRKQDIEEAKKILSAAGVDPTKITLKLLSAAQNPYRVHYEQAVAVKGILERNLGFKVELTPVANWQAPAVMRETGSHLANISDGGVGNLILDDPLWAKLHTTSAQNASLWSDKKTDELIEKQTEALDTNERKRLFAEIQRYLMQDEVLPVAPTSRNFDWFSAKKEMRGWTAPGYFLSNYPWQFNKVWLDR